MGEIARLVPVLPVSLIATVLLEAERPLDELELKVRASDLMAHFERRGRQALSAARRSRLCLPCRPAHAGAAPPGRGKRRRLFVGGGNRPAAARVLCQRHRPSALTMITTLWRIAYSAAHRLLHQPALDFGRGDGVLHDVRDRPDHDLQHRHRRAVRRQADGAGGDLRCAGARSWRRISCRASGASPTQDLFRGGGIAAIIGAAVLLYTGTRVFVELDDGIDAIWRDRKTRSLHPVLASLKSRLLALALDGRAGCAADRRHPGERAALGLCRRARKLSRSSATGSGRRCRRRVHYGLLCRPSSP